MSYNEPRMSKRKSRKRGVVLTDEALLAFNRGLAEWWEASGKPNERFSRTWCAQKLGVSASTIERIQSKRGNDRGVLILLFEELGLEWDDALCLPASSVRDADEQDAEVVDAEESTSQEEPPGAPAMDTPDLPRRRSWLAVPFAAAGIAIVLAVALALRPNGDLDRAARSVTEKMTAARQAANEEKYALARQHAAEASRLADWAGLVEPIAGCARLEGDIFSAEGNLEAAVERYRQSLFLWRTFNRPHGLGTLLEALGVGEARLGHLDKANEYLRESLAVLEQSGMATEAAGTMRGLGNVAAVRGNRDSARHWYTKARQAIAHRPDDAMHIDLRALEALLLSDEGRHDEALSMLRRCLTQWEKLGHHRWIAATLLQLAAVQFRAGRDAEAEAGLRRARTLYESVRDKKGLAECDAVQELGAKALDQQARRIEAFF